MHTGDANATVTRQELGVQGGPTGLVGHSCGGTVISEAGTHDKVAALVHVAAYAPDKGEPVGPLTADPPPAVPVPVPPNLPPKGGFLFLDRDSASFADDLPADRAAFLADSRVPWGADALGGSVTDPDDRPGRASFGPDLPPSSRIARRSDGVRSAERHLRGTS
ncbi:alpha/beta fold hydrolase [Streptomyces sp. NPDC090798]|uniref:alpha/beta fold hydrolase n=1 Tax=Streptomyces sp. NPDC090798 TaxID=3365968 RepID=UPI003813ABB5